nr:Chain A, W37 [synthetic construct]
APCECDVNGETYTVSSSEECERLCRKLGVTNCRVHCG